MQGTPAGLPFGKPGMGLEMEGAMQHAAQGGRQDFMSRIVIPEGQVVQNLEFPILLLEVNFDAQFLTKLPPSLTLLTRE